MLKKISVQVFNLDHINKCFGLYHLCVWYMVSKFELFLFYILSILLLWDCQLVCLLSYLWEALLFVKYLHLMCLSIKFQLYPARDIVYESLEKLPENRTDDDIETLLDFMRHFSVSIFLNILNFMKSYFFFFFLFLSLLTFWWHSTPEILNKKV